MVRFRPDRNLLSGVLFVQSGAHGQGSVGIDGAITFLDKLNDALLIDDDVGAQSPFIGFIVLVVLLEDAVGLEHLTIHVAEERKFDADLFCECGVGSGTIYTDTEDFRIQGVNLTGGDSSLDRLKLLRSTAGEGQDVDGEKNILLSAIVAELHSFPLVAEESEVRGGVADLEGHLGDFGLPGSRSSRSRRDGGSNQ
jgi:hypothetical protein